MNLKKTTLLLAASMLLVACKSETENNLAQSSTPNAIIAYDKLASVALNTQTNIDLSRSVSGENIVITGIFSDTPERCFAEVNQAQSVAVQMYESGRCDYTYVAQDNSGLSAEAKLILVSAKAGENPILPTITFNTSIGVTGNEINLAERLEISAQENENYSLSDLSIQSELGAAELEQADLTIDELTMQFNSPESIGWHKISYVLTYNDGNVSSQIGDIFISVTDGINLAPEISNPSFIYTGGSYIFRNDQITIDLSNKTEICDALFQESEICLTISDKADEASTATQDWQLINVKAIGADVALKDPNSITDKRFTFSTTGTEGFYTDVSYMVADYEGATSTGSIRIFSDEDALDFGRPWKGAFTELNFDVDNTAIDWTEHNYSKPLTHPEAVKNSNNHKYHTEEIYGKRYLVSTWNKDEAAMACDERHAEDLFESWDFQADTDDNVHIKKKIYRLPTIENFTRALQYSHKSHPGKSSEKFIKYLEKYPKDKKYFILDNHETRQIKMLDLDRLYKSSTAALGTDMNKPIRNPSILVEQSVEDVPSNPDNPEDALGYITCYRCDVLNMDKESYCY